MSDQYPLPPINNIQNFIINPCDAPMTIYIETLLPALGKFALDYMSFGLADIARGSIKPSGRRGVGHFKKRKKGVRFNPLKTDIGDEIGKVLGGKLGVQAPKFAAASAALFEIVGPIAEAGYWMLLLDITNDLFVNWNSGLLESGFCRASAFPRGQAQGGPGIGLAIQNWHTIGMEQFDYSHDVDIGVFAGDVPEGLYQFVYAVRVEATGVTGLQGFQAGFSTDLAFTSDVQSTFPISLLPFASQDVILAGTFHGPGNFGWATRSFTSNYEVTAQSLTVIGGPT